MIAPGEKRGKYRMRPIHDYPRLAVWENSSLLLVEAADAEHDFREPKYKAKKKQNSYSRKLLETRASTFWCEKTVTSWRDVSVVGIPFIKWSI